VPFDGEACRSDTIKGTTRAALWGCARSSRKKIMDDIVVRARRRSVTGRRVKALRKTGVLPGNVYGSNIPSVALELDAHAFGLALRHIRPSTVVSLEVEGEAPRRVTVHHTQYSVRNGAATHVEFVQVNPS
jgi:ribosomal protein L25 (general stress protein Ctc)